VLSHNKRSQGSANRVMPPKFFENKVTLRFERRYPKQDSVFRRELNILAPKIFCNPQTYVRGYAILSRHQFFIIQNFEQLAFALKNRVALNFFTVLKCFLSLRIFEQLALALENGVCPDMFHCVGYNFYIQDF